MLGGGLGKHIHALEREILFVIFVHYSNNSDLQTLGLQNGLGLNGFMHIGLVVIQAGKTGQNLYNFFSISGQRYDFIQAHFSGSFCEPPTSALHF